MYYIIVLKKDKAEIELFSTCKEVISYMDNITTAVNELNTAWEEVN